MAIAVVCPQCGSARSIDDNLRGKEVRCESCQTAFLVGTPVQEELEAAEEYTPAPPPPAPRKAPPRSRVQSDEPADVVAMAPPRRRPRRSNLRLVLMILVSSALVLLVIGGFAAVLIYAFVSGGRTAEAPKDPGVARDLLFGNPGQANQQPDAIQPNGDGGRADKGDPVARTNTDIGRRIYSRLLKSTVLIVNRTQVAGQRGITVGSGTLVDRTNRLIITNYHVAGRSNDLYIFFPLFKNGKLVAEFSYFVAQMDNRNVLRGKSVYPMPDKDLAVVQVDRLPPDALALPIAKDQPNAADQVYSVGHPGAGGQIVGLWIFTGGTIRTLTHKRWQVGKPPEEILSIDADIVLTNSQTNHGDSGGPLVNDHGELVAVTQGAFTEANAMSIFINAMEARAVLRRYADDANIKLDLPNGPAVQGDISGIADLLVELKDNDVGKRRRAAMSLGSYGADAQMAVPDLIVTLKDKDPFVRRNAEGSLDKIGAPSKAEVKALVRILDDPSPELRLRALDALAGVGPDAESALPAVLKLARDGDARVRAAAVRALGRAGAHSHDRVLTPLADAAKDADKTVRVAAAEALAGELPLDAGDVGVLLDLLHQPDAEVRVEGAHAAKKIGRDAREARPLLLTALKDPSTDLRRAAMEALVAVGIDKSNLPALEAALKDKDYEVRRFAIAAAVKLGSDARPVVGLVADGFKEWRLRAVVLDALARLGPTARDPHVMQVLNDALASEQFQVQAAVAVAAIHPTGDEAKIVVPKLLTLIDMAPTPTNQLVRTRAMEALGKTGKYALEDLQKRLKDPRPYVRAAAAGALGEMGADARPAVPTLTLLQLEENAEVRAAAGEAIKKIER
jgi:HEAT repeat protein